MPTAGCTSPTGRITARIQVFNGHGRYETEWRNLHRPSALFMTARGFFMPVFGLGMKGRTDLDAKVLAEATRPIIDTCIELFGPERCMFESNFPATREFVSYKTMWNCYKLAIADLSPSEKRAVLHDTAKSFYRISY